jgi:hypothetical protein
MTYFMGSCVNKELRELNRAGAMRCVQIAGTYPARAGDPAKKSHVSLPFAVFFVKPSPARTYLAQTGIIVTQIYDEGQTAL